MSVYARGLGGPRNGLPTGGGYVYRGQKRTTAAELAAIAATSADASRRARDPRWRRGDPIEHGTARGARQHYVMGESPCEACRAARSAHRAEA